MLIQDLQFRIATFTTNRKEQKRFVKFAIVGAIGALVDFAVLNLLVQVGRLPWYIAATIAFCCAVLSNFTWNRFWSFPESRQRALLPQLGQFALANVAGLLLNLGIMFAMMHWLLPHVGIDHKYDYNIAKAVAIGIVLFWNFGVNRVTTYKGL